MITIEVFKTNVKSRGQANKLLRQIHQRFGAYKATFDLDDCDSVLRIVAYNEIIVPEPIMFLINEYGFIAEVLDDSL